MGRLQQALAVSLLVITLPALAAAFSHPPASGRLASGSLGLRMADSGATRTALVTGSTDGIGQHTAERLAQDGWEVLIHGRNPKRIQATLARIQKSVPGARLHSFQADLASFADVRRLAEDVSGQFPKLDLLVNNAGVYEESMQTTSDGNEFVFQVNVLSPFLLTSLLLDTVSKAPEPRIIITSSISQSSSLDWDNLQMEKGFSAHGSYSSSKLCNVCAVPYAPQDTRSAHAHYVHTRHTHIMYIHDTRSAHTHYICTRHTRCARALCIYTTHAVRTHIMYVCMYVFVYVYMHVCMHICMHACMYVCMCVCVCACMYVCMHICMHACMYLCIYVCMYVRTHARTHASTHARTHASTYKHTHTHARTRTCTRGRRCMR